MSFTYTLIQLSSCSDGNVCHWFSLTSNIPFQAAIASFTGKLAAQGKEYVNTAEKVKAKGGDAYLTKESKRLLGMIAGKSILPEKKTAFELRHNVLSAFINSE